VPSLFHFHSVAIYLLAAVLNLTTSDTRLSRVGVCDYGHGMAWISDLLTTCTHHSELHVITALSPISTLHKSPQHPLSLFPACYVFNSRSLATASNSGDFSASRAHIVTVRWISHNWTLVNCQL
jgi:hypothetical protein